MDAMSSSMTDIMRVAGGAVPADLMIVGGRVVNVFTGEILDRDVLVRGDTIAAVLEPGAYRPSAQTEVIDAAGRFVTPGLIDAHFHVGGSHLDPVTLADVLLGHGTTTLATDFYELYTTGGPAGARYGIDAAHHAGLTIWLLPPAHLLGLQEIGTFAWDVTADDMIEMLEWPESVGIMEPPASAVLTGNPELMRVAAHTRRLRKAFAGHAPDEGSPSLNAYITTGATSDHESRTAQEGLDKLRLGMRAMMREGSASHDLGNLIELVTRYPASSRFLMLCSDETDPTDLLHKGHMDEKIRLCVAAGIDPVVAVQMGSINTAEYYGLSDRAGSVAPGRQADLLLVDDLDDFRPSLVVSRGRPRTRGSADPAAVPPPSAVQSAVRLAHPASPAELRIPAPHGAGSSVRTRVIGVHPGTLVSTMEERDLPVRDGAVVSAPDRDVLKIAVFDRNRGSGRVGLAFAEGVGFASGAVAMTYCHPFHNLVVIGTDDEQMAQAVNEVADLGGGISVVADGVSTGSWRLPLAGVLDSAGLDHAEERFVAVNEALRDLGCELPSPVLSIAFIALPTIPAYGLTDRGLFDVAAQRFLPLLVEEPRA
jgi:adenine deaminase